MSRNVNYTGRHSKVQKDTAKIAPIKRKGQTKKPSAKKPPRDPLTDSIELDFFPRHAHR